MALVVQLKGSFQWLNKFLLIMLRSHDLMCDAYVHIVALLRYLMTSNNAINIMLLDGKIGKN